MCLLALAELLWGRRMVLAFTLGHTRHHPLAAPVAGVSSPWPRNRVAFSDSWVGRNPPSVKAESPRVRRRGVSDARCPGCARETALYEDAAENERDHIVNWRTVPDRLRPECRALPCIDDQRRRRIGFDAISYFAAGLAVANGLG